MAHRRATAEDGQVGLAEDLTDKAHPAHDAQIAPVGRREAGGLLTAVLERVQREEHEARGLGGIVRRLGRWTPDAADAAHG